MQAVYWMSIVVIHYIMYIYSIRRCICFVVHLGVCFSYTFKTRLLLYNYLKIKWVSMMWRPCQ